MPRTVLCRDLTILQPKFDGELGLIVTVFQSAPLFKGTVARLPN